MVKRKQYLSRKQFAERIGVQPSTLSNQALPEPDALIGDVRGWLPATVDRWQAKRPRALGNKRRTRGQIVSWPVLPALPVPDDVAQRFAQDVRDYTEAFASHRRAPQPTELHTMRDVVTFILAIETWAAVHGHTAFRLAHWPAARAVVDHAREQLASAAGTWGTNTIPSPMMEVTERSGDESHPAQ